MHFNADHSRFYVACSDDDAIDIVDVVLLEVIGRRELIGDQSAN
ncbi:MAG TPA: hypothetical protein VKC66_08015 [Xanthobacteraceae bacterium]|nr:hypothetical protein [Xanthobacteraceae bacterium]